MGEYVKPMILVNDELAEGVYAASGNEVACDSQYMNGVYHAPQYGAGAPNNQIDGEGCQGCPANRNNSYCGVGEDGDQAFKDGYTSYDADKGNRMPAWEKQGKDPYEARY